MNEERKIKLSTSKIGEQKTIKKRNDIKGKYMRKVCMWRYTYTCIFNFHFPI